MRVSNKLKEAVEKSVRSKALGLHIALNMLCLKEAGMDCVDLLLNDPARLKEVVGKFYQSEYALTYILRDLLIKPILAELGHVELGDELVKLLIDDPGKFKEEITVLLEKTRLLQR